jgi:hypothetical protein
VTRMMHGVGQRIVGTLRRARLGTGADSLAVDFILVMHQQTGESSAGGRPEAFSRPFIHQVHHRRLNRTRVALDQRGVIPTELD